MLLDEFFVDLKYSGKKNIQMITPTRSTTMPFHVDPYFYVICRNERVKWAKEKQDGIRVINIWETDYTPIIRKGGSRYEPDPNYKVLKIFLSNPKYTREVAEEFKQEGFRVSAFNVKFLVRCAFDLGLRFFGAVPLYYGFDSTIIDKIKDVKILVLDVEAEGDKVTLVSTYEYRPFEEVSRENVRNWEANELEDLEDYLRMFFIIGGHNIIGYDIPVLSRNGCRIDTGHKCIIDTCQSLTSWAPSLQVGSARSLLELSRVLKDECGVTDEEIEIKDEYGGRIFSLSPEELKLYNSNDVVLTCKILNVIFPFLAILSGLLQIPLSVLQTLSAGIVAEYFFLRWCELHGFVPEYSAIRWSWKRQERAYALKEKTLFRAEKGWICQYDINMMYPSYVLHYYIDPTLLVKEPERTKSLKADFSDVEGIEDEIEFDRKGGLGILWSAVRYLKEVRLMTKKMKKENPLFSPVDKGVKAVLNALAYGVQGKQGSPTPLGNLACPVKIFFGTTKLQYKIYNSLRNLGYRVIYGDTDSVFVETDDPERVEKLVNELIAPLSVKLEGKGKAMYIYSKKSYIWFLEDGKVVVKGSPFKSRVKFQLPKIVSERFEDLILANEDERFKIIEKAISEAETKDLFAHVTSPFYRLLGKDVQTVKRSTREERKRYGIVRTVWDDVRTIYLKKGNPSNWCSPSHFPLLKLLIEKGGEIDLSEFNGLTIVEACGLPILKGGVLSKNFSGRALLYMNGSLYSFTLNNLKFVIETKNDVKEVPSTQSDRVRGGVLTNIIADYRAKEVEIDESNLRKLVLVHTVEVLKNMGLGVGRRGGVLYFG